MDVEPIRELETAQQRHARGDEDLMLGIAMQFLRRIEWCSFAADLSAGSHLRWEIAATSAADAELLHDLVRGGQAAAKLALPAFLETLDREAELRGRSSSLKAVSVAGA